MLVSLDTNKKFIQSNQTVHLKVENKVVILFDAVNCNTRSLSIDECIRL